MDKKRKVLFCSILLVCASILLFIGIQQKYKNYIMNKFDIANEPYKGTLNIEGEEFEFNEESKVEEITVVLKNNKEDIHVVFPQLRQGDIWIIDNEDVVLKKTVMNGSENCTEFMISTQNQTLTALSFKNAKSKDVKKNQGSFDVPATFRFNLNIDYEANEDLKNVFLQRLFKLGDAVYCPRKYGNDAYIEIPLDISYEDRLKLKDESEYALQYEFIAKTTYDQGHAFERIKGIKTVDRYTTTLIQYLNDEHLEKIEESIDNGEAIIEVNLTPIKNNRKTFTCTKTIKHSN